MKQHSKWISLALGLLAAVTLAAGAPAQDSKPGEPGKGSRIELNDRDNWQPKLLKEMSKVLNLTAQQYGAIKAHLENERRQILTVRRNTANAAQMRSQVQIIRRDTQQKIMAVLTPQQREQWREHVKNKRKKDPTPGTKPPR